MLFLKFLLFFVSCFIFPVLLIMLFKRCSARKAVRILKDFFKDILEELFKPTPPPVQYYPTIVGWDGTRIVHQLVKTAFKSVSENFEVCYLTRYGFSTNFNCVGYFFSITRKADSLADEDLQNLIQKQAEEIVTEVMHQYDFFMPAEPLTLVELRKNELRVAFARTEAGISEIDVQKRKLEHRKLMANRPKPPKDMTTDWDREKREQ